MKETLKKLFRRRVGDTYPRVSTSDLKCGPGKTQPHHAEEVDINRIVDRYMKTGELSNRAQVPVWGDALMRAPKSLQEASERLIAARVAFMKLPSSFRAELDNNPATWVDRVTKKDGYTMSLMAKYGMLDLPKGEAPNSQTTSAPKEAAPEEKPNIGSTAQ